MTTLKRLFMRLRIRRYLVGAYLVSLVFGVFLWAWSYWRSIGVAHYHGFQPTEFWVSCRFLLMERGVIAFGRQGEFALPAEWESGRSYWKFYNEPIRQTDPLLPPSFTYDDSPVWNRCGFGVLNTESSAHGISEVFVPIWALLPVWAIPAVGMLVSRQRRASRARRGFCPFCGYNLCASNERCPECGKDRPRA